MNPGAGHVEPGASPLRIFQISRGEVLERTQLPDQHADGSFWWVACSHVAFETRFADLQTMLATVWFLYVAFFHSSDIVPGWASTVLPMLFLGGVQLLSIGVLGEYVGKIYLETKRRPRFIIQQTTDEGMSAQARAEAARG